MPEGEYTIPLGVADVKREGSDVTVVGIHTMVHKALKAAERAGREKASSVEVIDPRTLVPLDEDTIVESVQEDGPTDRLPRGVRARRLRRRDRDARWSGRAFDYLDAPIERVCGKNVPMPYAESLESRRCRRSTT